MFIDGRFSGLLHDLNMKSHLIFRRVPEIAHPPSTAASKSGDRWAALTRRPELLSADSETRRAMRFTYRASGPAVSNTPQIDISGPISTPSRPSEAIFPDPLPIRRDRESSVHRTGGYASEFCTSRKRAFPYIVAIFPNPPQVNISGPTSTPSPIKNPF